MRKPPEYMKNIDDVTLMDLIYHQQSVVDDLVDHAQELAKKEDREVIKSLDGLYFATLRYKEYVAEMQARWQGLKDYVDNPES